MKRNDGHVTTPDLTLPVVGPKREDIEETKEIETAAFYASCESDDDYAELTAVAHELRAKHKALTAERDAIIKPINAAVTRIRTMYKPTLESLDASCNRIKMIMMGYQQKLTERRSMAELKARQALIMGDHASLVKHTAEAVQQPAFAGSHTRKTWKLRITDVEKVPRQFLTVDTAALKRYAIAHGWQDAPEGVEFYQEEGIALR